MTSLGLVGIADKGTYSAETTYNKGQFVLHEGSTWLALKDNLNGVTPAEGENWKYLARGFAAELLSLVTAIDSQGLSGSQGGQVNAQSLIDVLADKVANQLIAKSMMSNVQVNDAEKVPTSALAYSMQQAINVLNTKTIFEKIPPRKGNLDTIENINSSLDNWSNDMPNLTFYIGVLPTGISHPIFGGSTLNLFGARTNSAHEWQILVKYDTNGACIFSRCKIAGTWQGWTKK